MDASPSLVIIFVHHLGLFALIVMALAIFRSSTDAVWDAKQQVLSGLVFGLGAVLAMLDSVQPEPGLQFDARLVIVSVSGPFGGLLSALVTAVIAGVFRLWLGGAGAGAAVASIVACALAGAGLAAYLRHRGQPAFKPRHVAVLALLVSAITLSAFPLLPPDIRWRAFETVAVPLSALSFVGTGILGSILVEERRRRELQQRLAAASRRNWVVANNAADGLITIDDRGIVETFNAAAEHMFGYRAAEAIGQNVNVLMPQPHQDQRDDDIGRFLRTGEARNIGKGSEVTGRRKDGTLFPMELRIAAFELDGRRLFTASARDLTEQKRTALSLQEREALYRFLAENTGDVITRTDLSLKRNYVSPAAFDLFGYQPEELLGQAPTNAVHPDDAPAFQEKLRGLVAGLVDNERSVHRFRHKAGRWVWVEVTLRLVRSEAREPKEIVSVIRDISERQRQAEALEGAKLEAERVAESLRLRDRSLEAIGQGVIIADAQASDDSIIYVNPAFERLTGYAAAEVIGRNCRFLQGPETDRAATARLRAALRSGRPATETLINYRKDGTAFVNELAIAPVRSWTGQVTHFVGVQADVTARTRSEEALQRSREELRAALAANQAILEHSQDVICTIDGEGCFTQVSPQALTAWGFRPEELIGRRYADFVHPEDQEKTEETARKIMSGTPTSGFENRFIRSDGTVTPILWSAVWSDEHKTMYCVARDLSERLQLEEQLRQSQKMEALGQLTGGIAHDFNNLLTVILGNAEVLTEDPSDPALTYTLARQILETAERGADLNQKLLAFGRRQPLKPTRLKVGRVVGDLVPLVYRTIGEHIELQTQLSDSGHSAILDRALLESAILNLAVNARDAMPQGGTLTITTGVRAAQYGEGVLPIGQAVVFITVADTGTGMTPEVLERVFEPFFTTKEVGKGSGLGLSMVFGFARQSAGHVSIESKPGAGTAVTILLPAIIGEAEQPAAEKIEAPVPAATRARVLLVEDEPPVLQFVSSQFANLGYDVTAASNGLDALDLLQGSLPFDLLFTDVMLPKGMSGVELARQARALRPGIKVLLTSGYPEEIFEHQGRPDEDMPLLRKPYRRKQLQEALRKVLEPDASSEEPEALQRS